MYKFILILTLFYFNQCQALINFKVPPFTITNAQTAAEKQMVGEDRDLERDGWLVSSIQSSSGGASNSKKANNPSEEDSKFFGHLQRISYLSSEVKRYKIHGMIGEGIAGILKINPLANTSPFFGQYDLPARKKRIDDVVSLVNESRKVVSEKQVEVEKIKGTKEEELKLLKQSIVDGYQKNVVKGEFYESSLGKWERL